MISQIHNYWALHFCRVAWLQLSCAHPKPQPTFAMTVTSGSCVSLQANPYLYNQYAGMPAAAGHLSAGMGQLPLQFAVSQGAPTAVSAAAPATATLESQGMAPVKLSTTVIALPLPLSSCSERARSCWHDGYPYSNAYGTSFPRWHSNPSLKFRSIPNFAGLGRNLAGRPSLCC